MKKLGLWFLLVCPMSLQAANVVTLTAQPSSGSGSVVPVLTWSTTPVAASCTASGDWSGTKTASGSQTLATVTSSKIYNLLCTWPDGQAAVFWAAPTQNTDGTPYTNAKGFKILWGSSAGSLTQNASVNVPNATSYAVLSLATGTWFFAVRAVNLNNVESVNSNVASKAVTSTGTATATATATVTVNAASSQPNPPTNITVTQ